MSDMVHVSRHPLLLHRLAMLRHLETRPRAFRSLVREMSQMLFFEATTELKLATWTVQTPMAHCQGEQIAERFGLAPILRAGLGMSDAILELMPDAQVWHLGLYRDHETTKPVTYYNRLRERANLDLAFVVDPMLATGGSAVAAIDILKAWGVPRLKFLGLIAAPEGVALLRETHPDVPLHLAAIDSHLDEHSYIVPGLGDAGDRQFATF